MQRRQKPVLSMACRVKHVTRLLLDPIVYICLLSYWLTQFFFRETLAFGIKFPFHYEIMTKKQSPDRIGLRKVSDRLPYLQYRLAVAPNWLYMDRDHSRRCSFKGKKFGSYRIPILNLPDIRLAGYPADLKAGYRISGWISSLLKERIVQSATSH